MYKNQGLSYYSSSIYIEFSFRNLKPVRNQYFGPGSLVVKDLTPKFFYLLEVRDSNHCRTNSDHMARILSDFYYGNFCTDFY